MLLVLPFCSKDVALALQNLKWIQELDARLPYLCVLSHDNETPATFIRDMNLIANQVFDKVEVFWYQAPEKKHWPAAANWAFQNAAQYIAYYFPNESWLFLEADATPIRSGWLQQLEAEYKRGGKPIMGHVVHGMGHPNGVAIYPGVVAAYSQDAMRVEETAWDVVIGASVDKQFIHDAGHIIRHCWNQDEITGECTNGHGISPTFKSVQEVVSRVDLNAALFHRCKDGSLIHWLREYYKAPHKAMVPDHTSHEEDKQVETTDAQSTPGTAGLSETNNQEDAAGQTVHAGIQKAQAENRTSSVVSSADRNMANKNQEGKVGGPLGSGQIVQIVDSPKAEIFIVTYWKDFLWLDYCLKCIQRHAKGFAGVTLMVPNRDVAKLDHSITNSNKEVCRLVGYDEVEGKGMVQHMAVICMADQYVPQGTECVLHMDADCMFKEDVTPAEYFQGTKPVYVVRSYDSLIDAKSKVISDCYQWRSVVEKTLAKPARIYGMCRHPTGFPIGFYKRFRNYIESKHHTPFAKYVLEQRNEFPQTFAEFPTMGAFAYEHMRDKFKWIDISEGNHLAPKDKLQAYWSHSNKDKPDEMNFVPDGVKAEIESFLK